MVPRKPWVLCCALLLVLVAGCELRAGAGVVVDGDGGGRVSYTIAADDELRRTARRAGADPLGDLAAAGGQLEGWTVTRRTEGRTQGVSLSTGFADPAELARVSRQFTAAVAGPELTPMGPWSLEVDDATVELTGRAALELTPAVADLGVAPARARRVLADAVSLRIVARMPGEVLETNADDRPDDATVGWTVRGGQRRTLHVVARRPWDLARVVRLLVTTEGMLVLAIGIAMIYDWRRIQRDRPAPLVGV